tara:strand:- start:56 stop:1531 length:1476 start_codon:yes stop_codon:yes gene_type:complete
MNFDNSFLEDKIKKGINLLESNDLINAEIIFQELKNNKKSESISLLFLGIIQIKNKNFSKAKIFFDKILINEPNNQDANLNMGLIYLEEKKYENSILFFDKVIKINQNNINAQYHKGLANFFLKKYSEAIVSFKICINLDKNFSHSYLNLGHIHLRLKNFEHSVENYLKVLKLEPRNNNAKFNLAWNYFALIKLDDAFKYYEFRREKINPSNKIINIKKKYTAKEWYGENLNNKRILIVSEQGIGDNIQFFRYLYCIKEQYKAEIYFYTDEKLKHLFEKSPFKIICDLSDLNNVDFYQHLLSLPGIFYKEKKKIQKNIPYIKINNINNTKWKNKLSKFKKPIIALNWQGDKNFLFDDTRSIKLSFFEKLIQIKKYNFISIQKNFGSEQINLNNFSEKIKDFSNEIDENNRVFEDTISILNNIDMLVTSDTAVAHLAGTMQIKTYLLLSNNPEWRWHIENKMRCFYPNINIIQQDKDNDWTSVFKKLENTIS